MKVPNQKLAKWAKCFSLYFLLLPSFIRRASSVLREPLMLVYTNQQHFLWSSAQPQRFFTTSKSHKALVTTHTKTMTSSLGCQYHSYLYACTLKDHLATKQKLLLKIAVQSLRVPGMGLKNQCMCCVVNRTRHLKRLR